MASENKDTPRVKPEKNSSGGTVKIKVTKFGGGKVSTGEHVAELGDVMAKGGDILEVDKSVAEAMEATGYGEIQ